MKYVNQPVQKNRCHGTGNRKACVHGRPGTERFPDRQSPAKPSCQCMGRHDQDGYSKESSCIVCVFTYEDVPQKRFTLAGQTAPEMSPDDRLILDRHVRFVGDAVAIVAGETEAAVDLALRRIKVNIRWKHRSSTSILQKIIRSWCTRRRTGNSRSRLAAIIRETYVLQQGKNMVM